MSRRYSDQDQQLASYLRRSGTAELAAKLEPTRETMEQRQGTNEVTGCATAAQTRAQLIAQLLTDMESNNAGWRLGEVDRILLWEVTIAQRCIQNFSRIINTQAIVLALLATASLMGYLHPPRGLQDSTSSSTAISGSTGSTPPAIAAAASSADNYNGSNVNITLPADLFAVFNTMSFFGAMYGLLFYAYYRHATILSLASVPLPSGRYADELEMRMVRKLRGALRGVVLPSLRKRSEALFVQLAASLVCCAGAYVCAGVAATTDLRRRLVPILTTAAPSCIMMALFFWTGAETLSRELELDGRLSRMLWGWTGVEEPPLEPLDPRIARDIEYVPSLAQLWTKCCHRLSPSPQRLDLRH